MSSINNNSNGSSGNGGGGGFKSNSKLLINKFLSNINSTTSPLPNNTTMATSSSTNAESSSNTSNHSALNVITSAAAAAVNSIHNMITSTNGSSSSSSSPSSTCSTNHHNHNHNHHHHHHHNNHNHQQSHFDDHSSASVSNNNIISSLSNQNHHRNLISSNNSNNNHGSTASSINIGNGGSSKIEKKHFDKINKLADKIMRNCQSEKMNLINSPPYIIDILPDICQVFNTIFVVYENKIHVLNDIEYFTIQMRNCLEKFQQLLDLFKTAGKRMYEETSEERQKLIKYTLIYSHILAEIKSIFPKDVYEGQTYRIAKKDAEDFWKSNFQERVVINWKEFEIKLNRVHKISNQIESNNLRETIQLTKSKYVSIFEFDIFTRLFQPWNNLLNNWKFLVTEHPAYCAFSTYDEVHRRLQKHINKPGSYLFRLSCTKLGQWAIGYVTTERKILQTIPQSLVQALIDGAKQGLYVYPDARDIQIDISSAIAVTSASRIQISKEQFEQYSDVGLSFQICKICAENNKDRKLEPCGHLICSKCLENWQDLHAISSCPFCRCEIKAFEPIIISPFESQTNLNGGITSNNKKNMSLLNENKNITNEMNKKNNNNVALESASNSNSFGSDENSTIYLKPQEPNVSKSPTNTTGVTLAPTTSKSTLALNTAEKSKEDTSSQNEEHLILNKSTKMNGKNNDNDLKRYNPELLIKNDIEIGTQANGNIDLLNTPNRTNSVLNFSSPIMPSPPLLPPPPPPPPTSRPPTQQLLNNSNLNNSGNKPNLISAIYGTNSIQLNIENEALFDQLAVNFNNDKLKAACALVLANNDFKIAKEIFLLSNNLF